MLSRVTAENVGDVFETHCSNPEAVTCPNSNAKFQQLPKPKLHIPRMVEIMAPL